MGRLSSEVIVEVIRATDHQRWAEGHNDIPEIQCGADEACPQSLQTKKYPVQMSFCSILSFFPLLTALHDATWTVSVDHRSFVKNTTPCKLLGICFCRWPECSHLVPNPTQTQAECSVKAWSWMCRVCLPARRASLKPLHLLIL